MKALKPKVRKILLLILLILVAVIIIFGICLLVRGCNKTAHAEVTQTDGVERLESILLEQSGDRLYGLKADEFDIIQGEIESGETFSKLLNGRFNLNISTVNKLVEKSKGVYELRMMRAGNSYSAFLSPDSTQTLQYLVYNRNNQEYVRFDCNPETPSVAAVTRDIAVKERYFEGTIDYTLWNALDPLGYPNQASNALGAKLDNIYKWSIDFHALQKGDKFRLIYEEIVIDTVVIGIGKIYGAEFIHAGQSNFAISFQQGAGDGYWDQNGVNLRKEFLKAPLSIQARISSRFGTRVHPITRRRGQHNGVDYACPTGTPINAVADGTITTRGWDRGGGGNMIKIRHARNTETYYLHLSRFASGISVGTRVRQGQVIGYVGSTGMSTGPHLDYRIKQNGRFVDPTKIKSTPTDPINKAHKESFALMKQDVLKVMDQYQTEM